MKEINDYLVKIETILEKDDSYKFEAYTFVLSGLHETLKALDKPRHISGGEFALGLKDFALEQFGPMAKTVLNYWGIYETLDFGKIVFALVEVELMKKTEDDKTEDFENVYDFDEAFSKSLF